MRHPRTWWGLRHVRWLWNRIRHCIWTWEGHERHHLRDAACNLHAREILRGRA